MRRACDTLRQENLQKDMELLKASILSTPSTSNIKSSAQAPPTTSASINEGNRNILTKPILKNRSAVSPYRQAMLYVVSNIYPSIS